MRNLERTEKEMWDRYKDGQDAAQIARAMQIPQGAVQNFLEERRILGIKEDRTSKKKTNRMPSRAPG